MAQYNARINFQVRGIHQITEANAALNTLEQRVKSLKSSRINLNPITRAASNRYEKFVDNTTKIPKNLTTSVEVSGLAELQELEKSLRYINSHKSTTVNVKAKTSSSSGGSGGSDTVSPRTVYVKGKAIYQDGVKIRPSTYKNVSRNGEDIYGYNADYDPTFQAAKPLLTMNRRLSTVTEKLDNVAGRFMIAASYIGGQDLSNIILETPARAETQKYLLGNMQGTDVVFDKTTNAATSLYNTLDKTTDMLPISMQNVVQPLYAFQAATGASAQELNNIIPAFANFGAQVINMTGSHELAETAMEKLSRAYMGQYEGVNQYGISEAALKRVGYEEGGTVEEFMAAVAEITGDATKSMDNFNGVKQLISKDFARSGKRIWEGGLGQTLTSMLKGFHELDQGLSGLPTELLTVGGSVLSMATQISGATAAIGITISTFAQLASTLSQTSRAGGGLGNVFKNLLFGGFKSLKGESPDYDYYLDGEKVKTGTYEGSYQGTLTGIESAMGGRTINDGGNSDTDGKTGKTDKNKPTNKPTDKDGKNGKKSDNTKATEKVSKSNGKLTNTIEKTNKETKKSQDNLSKTIEKRKGVQTDDRRYNNAMKNLRDFANGKYEPNNIGSPIGGSKLHGGKSTLANPDLLAQVEKQRFQKEVSNLTKKNNLLKDEITLRKKLGMGLTTTRKKLGGIGSGLKTLGGSILSSNLALLGLGIASGAAGLWMKYAAANNQKAAEGFKIFDNSLSQGIKNIIGNIGNIAHDIGLSSVDGIEGAAEATGNIVKDAGLVIQTWTGQNHKYYVDDNGEVQKYSDKEYYGWQTEDGSSAADKERKKQMDMMSSWTGVASGAGGFFDWIGKVSTGESWGIQEVIDQKFAKSRENLAAGKQDKFYKATQGLNYVFNPFGERSFIKDFSIFGQLGETINQVKNFDLGNTLNELKGLIYKPPAANAQQPQSSIAKSLPSHIDIGAMIGNIFGGQGGQGQSAFDGLKTGLQNAIQGVMGNLGNLFGGQGGQGQGGQGGMGGLFKSLFDPNNINTAEISTNITTKTNEALATSAPQIKQSATESFKGVGEGMAEGLTQGNASVDAKLGEIENTFRSKNNTYGEVAHTGGVNATTKFGEGLGGMSDRVGAEMDEIVKAMRNKIPAITQAATEVSAAINQGTNAETKHESPGVPAKRTAAEMWEIEKAIRKSVFPIYNASRNVSKSIVDGYGFRSYKDRTMDDYIEDNSIFGGNGSGSGNGNGGTVVNNTFNIGSVDSKERVKEVAEAVAYIFNFNNETAGRNTDVGMTTNMYK